MTKIIFERSDFANQPDSMFDYICERMGLDVDDSTDSVTLYVQSAHITGLETD